MIFIKHFELRSTKGIFAPSTSLGFVFRLRRFALGFDVWKDKNDGISIIIHFGFVLIYFRRFGKGLRKIQENLFKNTKAEL